MNLVYILGISAYYHDSAAALLCNGEIIASAQEERFTRIKGDASFPSNAIDFCFSEARITEKDLSHVIFYENPLIKFERLTTISHLSSPNSLRNYLKAFPEWLTKKLWIDRVIAKELGYSKGIEFCEHHMSHAAAAFYPSPFEEAAILTIDGVGEWATSTIGIGRGQNIELIKEIRFPNSLGLLYSAFTYFTGFKINSGEYKLMGLAPYGKPIYADMIRSKLIHISSDGSIQLNQYYFNYVDGLKMTNRRFEKLFGGPRREPETDISQREMDIAASIQNVLNDAVLLMAKHTYEKTGIKNLVMSGGVALNVVSMGRISNAGIFDKLWIQPAAGDSGSALGAALWCWHNTLDANRTPCLPDSMKGSFLGPEIKLSDHRDDQFLKNYGAIWKDFEEDGLKKEIASLIASGKVVAIARGKMEWGPRALGNRSILGDARSPYMQKHMNQKIKFRESFRPFAPMVLEEDAHEYFDMSQNSPYMLLAFPVSESRRVEVSKDQNNLFGTDLLKVTRSEIPAVTHVDYSARVQTIDKERNLFMHEVINEFKKLTGCSVIINTSFNVRGEPIVNTSEDAYKCFMSTNIDCLILGNRLLMKEDQADLQLDEAQRKEWLGRFTLD